MSDKQVFTLVNLLRAIRRDNQFDELPETLQDAIDAAIEANINA